MKTISLLDNLAYQGYNFPMKAKEVRERYLKFFEKRGHVRIEPAPLVLKDDPTTLFTSAGMQPLIPFLLGKRHPNGKRLVDSQPSIRLQDIEEVGDNRHTTFFEMLGNWSLGDYFKNEQLSWFLEFLTTELNLSKERLWVSVFEGDSQVPKDEEAVKIWLDLGIASERIGYYDAKKNWWSIGGTPKEMPIGDIGGPDSEVFYDFGEEKEMHKNSLFAKETCHMNCDCGRFLEIGNCVFIQYKKVGDDKLEELPNKNVDFGGGLERIVAAVNNEHDIFKTDLFSSAIGEIVSSLECEDYGSDEQTDKSLRIIVDHLRASCALISSGILPGNKGQSYILRRLLRRAVLHSRFINRSGKLELPKIDFSIYEIPLRFKSVDEINGIVQEETQKFAKALESGMKKLTDEIAKKGKVSSFFAFDLYQTHGFPIEVTQEALTKQGKPLTKSEIADFQNKIQLHKKESQTAGMAIFKGGLADHSQEVIRLHTATHLLQASLRKVLGDHVLQRGQNITNERSRFDFAHDQKLTEEELLTVEKMINEKIDDGIPVKHKLMKKKDAEKTGAIHLFGEKYGEEVNVYYVGENFISAFSLEFCGGPHVANTKDIGHVRIKKQDKIGAGIIRVYLELI